MDVATGTCHFADCHFAEWHSADFRVCDMQTCMCVYESKQFYESCSVEMSRSIRLDLNFDAKSFSFLFLT